MNLEQIQQLQLETTSHCNAKCPHCPRYDGYGNLHRNLVLDKWDWSLIKNNLELDKLVNLQYVLLQGDKGDSLMHPNIKEIVLDFCNSPNKPIVELNTNGGLRSKDWWSNLAKEQLPNLYVAFSIDGLADTSPVYRRNVDYHKVLENAEAFIESGGNAIWQCLVFKHNQHQLNEIKQTAINMGFVGVNFASCDPGRFFGDTTWNIVENNKIVDSMSIPTISDEEISLLSTRPPYRYNTNRNIDYSCPNLNRGRLYVNSQADVIPCCMMHYEYEFYPENNPGTVRLIDEMIVDRLSHNLKNEKLSNILKNRLYGHALEQSFNENKFLPLCESCCGDDIRNNLKEMKLTQNRQYAIIITQ